MKQQRKESVVDASSFLVMRAGTLRCALSLGFVVETMRPLLIRPLANVPPFVTGISVVRGEPLPVVDLALLLESAVEKPGRFVIVKSGQRKVALAVETVVGIRQATPSNFVSLPPLVSKTHAEVIAGLGTLDQELLLVLQAARLVPEEAWSALDTMEEA